MNPEARSNQLHEIARAIRRDILVAGAHAGSGHPTSSLSAVDLMTGLCFGGTFRYDVSRPDHPNNDRLIFSKGHASLLLYALWVAAGQLTRDELLTYRRFGSPLEGHPSPRFAHVDVTTGSLGQGLSIGLGMALNARRFDHLPYRTYVLLGDSEMAEGSQWEAIQYASHRQLDNLIGILDVNRLGQRGETMAGHSLETYTQRLDAFGWRTYAIDGHDLDAILLAFEAAAQGDGRPTMVVARTIKGKGVPAIEDRDGYHGKVITGAQLEQALVSLGEIDEDIRGEIAAPVASRPPEVVARPPIQEPQSPAPVPEAGAAMATREAYGRALVRIAPALPDLLVLDAEVSNSTRTDLFAAAYPDRFLEMFVAEQNMVGVALGLACRGKLPFVSTFAAFLGRAFDQIRMSQYSVANLKFCGSHAGVAIGEDGPSQMGLEDLALFRSLIDSVVLYPADAVATDQLVEAAARHAGIVYLRTNRNETPVIYDAADRFTIGGSQVVRAGPSDRATIVAAGITLHEALAAHATLQEAGIPTRVIDLYSVRPVDRQTLREAADQTGRLVTVEDHAPGGGLGEAVREALTDAPVPVLSLAVRRKPMSGKPAELLAHAGIDRQAIVTAVRDLIGAGS